MLRLIARSNYNPDCGKQRYFFRGMFEEKHVLLVQWERIKWLNQPTHFHSGIEHMKALPLHTELRNLTLKKTKQKDMFHELLSVYATPEPICALEASFRRFLLWFCSMETSIVVGGNGPRPACAPSAVVLLCFKWHSREYQDEGFPNTFNIIYSYFYLQAVTVLMAWLICACTSPHNKTPISKVIHNKLCQALY